jgi:hypothetical protein
MAIIDIFSLFSGSYASGALTGQTVTGTNTTVNGTGIYDTQAGLTLNTGGQSVDLGKGQEFDIEFDITTAFAGATSVEFQVVNADDGALATNATTLASTGAIALAQLTAAARIVVPVPKADPRAVRRYLGVRYVIVGTGTAGAVVAGFTPLAGDLPMPTFKSGFAIS